MDLDSFTLTYLAVWIICTFALGHILTPERRESSEIKSIGTFLVFSASITPWAFGLATVLMLPITLVGAVLGFWH